MVTKINITRKSGKQALVWELLENLEKWGALPSKTLK